MSDKLIELVHIRNKLATENLHKEDMLLLKNIKSNISLSTSPFKDLAWNAINNCEENIKVNNWKLAAQEIQLIHDFAFNDCAKSILLSCILEVKNKFATYFPNVFGITRN